MEKLNFKIMHTRKEKMEAFGRFLDILDELREKCPWDRKQTKESLRPKGTLANGALRHKRILAHRALDAIWKEGYMTRHSAYIWLQNRLNLREKDMHIGMFSDYLCDESIRECTEYLLARRSEGRSAPGSGNRKNTA